MCLPRRGWSGGAMVLGELPVLGRPTILDYSRAKAYCACSRCGWGLFGHFYSYLSFFPLSPSLWETARYRLKYCLKGPLNPKPTKKAYRGLGYVSCLDMPMTGSQTFPLPPINDFLTLKQCSADSNHQKGS